METITTISFALAALFLVFLTRAVIKVIKDNRFRKKILKRSEAVEQEQEKLKRMGLKEFTFANGKVKIFAKSYKEANVKYQMNLKNRMQNI